ncbi:hypothetical protein [Pontibacterium sinense]|nr:hypothetical protein [Pontibacterium sinense]
MTKPAEPKKVRVAKRIGTVGALILGLSIYALLSDDPGSFYPELANPNVVTGMMVLAIICIAIEQFIKIPYYQEVKAKSKQEPGNKEAHKQNDHSE